MPRLLWELLAGFETGTVVCIAGFNDFRREEDDPTPMNSICRVAASNFSDAIYSGRLRVDVEDEGSGETLTVGRDNLGEVLTQYSQNKRAAKQGQISGQVAYNAWKTISLGERLTWHGERHDSLEATGPIRRAADPCPHLPEGHVDHIEST